MYNSRILLDKAGIINGLMAAGIIHLLCAFVHSILNFQYLQDLDDDEVAEMTKKKQRDCEVTWVHARRPPTDLRTSPWTLVSCHFSVL